MPERAPPLRDEPSPRADVRPFSNERLIDLARQSAARVRSGRRSTAIHWAQKLWVSRAEPFAFAALAEPDPWLEPVFACDLLHALVAFLRRHSRLDETGARVVALWIAQCWCIEWAELSPRLAITSAASVAGRSALLRLISALVPRPLLVARTAVKPLLTLIDVAHPTVLLDDADQWVFSDHRLCDVVTTGYIRDAVHLNPVYGAFEPLAHSSFTPCVYTCVGQPPAALARRSITVALAPPLPGETRQPTVIDKLVVECERLSAQLARWVRDSGAAVITHESTVPDGLSRAQTQNWRPLFAIANAAGNGWPERAGAAAQEIGSCDSDRDIGIELLTDIRPLVASADRVTSSDLVRSLLKDEERPWQRLPNGRKLDVRSLAKSLVPFGVRPRVMRIEGHAFARGYHAADFVEAFARYLGPVLGDDSSVNT